MTDEEAVKVLAQYPILGVRYNVVRRPLSGGAGSIRQHKPTKSNPRGESRAQFYARLGGLIREDPKSYFMRWRVEVSLADVETFRRQCLDPVLENLCDDYEWWEYNCKLRQAESPLREFDYTYRATMFSKHRARHFREPFGVYDPIKEGGSADLDNYLASGSEIGLQRATDLFPELAEKAVV